MPYFQMSDEETFAVLRAAVEAGFYLWSGADYYGNPEDNSLHLMNRYFTRYPQDADRVVLSISTGIVNEDTMEVDCSPDFIRRSFNAADAILDGRKRIDIFGIAGHDPKVPIEKSVHVLAELKREGRIGGIQLNEPSIETVHRASTICTIDVIEAEASMWSPMVFENGVAEACAELGIVLVAHSPLGMGALSGTIKHLDDLKIDDPRRALPRYRSEVFGQNVRFVQFVTAMARARGCSTAQFALSWLKGKSKRLGMAKIVPIVGVRSVERIWENAVDIKISDEEYAKIAVIQRKLPFGGL